MGGPKTAGPCVVRSDSNSGKNNNAGNGIVACGAAASCAGRADSASGRCEETELSTVDGLLERWGTPHISVVKVDVEGFECAVLEGAQALFTRVRPEFIYAELKFPHVAQCWTRQAQRHGYQPVRTLKGPDRNTLFRRVPQRLEGEGPPAQVVTTPARKHDAARAPPHGPR